MKESKGFEGVPESLEQNTAGVITPENVEIQKKPELVGEPVLADTKNIPDIVPESMETAELSPQFVGEYVDVSSAWHMLARDPSVKEGMKALLRTMANLGIVALDTFPLTEGGSTSADAMKVLAKLKWFKKLDFLTPHVPLKGAIGTELAEVGTLGVAPTHAYETLHQFFGHDKEALYEAYRAIREILRIRRESHMRHKDVVEKAVAVFKPGDIQKDI